jgi:hypothetical protein
LDRKFIGQARAKRFMLGDMLLLSIDPLDHLGQRIGFGSSDIRRA